MKKKLSKKLSLLLTFSMILTMLPAFSLGASAAGEPVTATNSKTLREALKKTDAAVLVELGSDVTGISATSTQTTVAGNVTLDLKGHSISRSSEATSCFLIVTGTLTIKDTVGGGKITAANNTSADTNPGGVVTVKEGGTLVLEGGIFDSCTTSKKGGAIAVLSGGTFTMSGGSITGCTATGNGGGVYNEGTFTMSGGTISDCTAVNGAGLYQTAGTFTLQDDAVMANKVTNYSKGTGVVTINGGWYVTNCGTWKGSDRYATGKCNDAPNSKAPYTVASSANYVITYDKGVVGEMTLSDGDFTDFAYEATHGTQVTLPKAEATGYNFTGWKDADDNAYSAGDKVEFSKAITLTAQWVDASAANVQVNDDTYPTIAAALAKAKENDTLTLLADISDEDITIENGVAVTLDLNGKVLTGTGSGPVITVEEGGSLTINDASQEKTGLITGGNTSGKSGNNPGAGIKVIGTVVMNGGTISGNTATSDYGSQVQLPKNKVAASFTMNGGKIIGSGSPLYAQDGDGNGNLQGTITVNGGWLSRKVSSSYVGEGKKATGKCADAPDAEAPYTVASTNTYTINYLNTDDSVVISEYTPKRGTQVSLKSMTDNTRETDKTVIAWYLSKDLTGTSYAPGDKVEFAAETTTLYAQWGTREAQIGTTVYETLGEAITGAGTTSAKTITLLCNVTGNVSIPANATITLDLNDCTITNSGVSKSKTIDVLGTASLTVTDKGENGSGKIDGAGTGYGIYVESDGTLTVEGGTIDNCNASAKGSAIYNKGALTIGGGTVCDCDSNDNSNSTIHSYAATGKVVTFTMTGGKVNGTITTGKASSEGTEAPTLVITGGTFSKDPKSLLHPDYRAVADDAQNPTQWTVEQKPFVAKINETEYRSITSAAEAAGAGETIVLQSDVTENAVIALSANVTLDLNGFTLSGDKDKVIANRGTLTIKDSGNDGKIQAAGTGGNTVYNYSTGTMTIESGIIDGHEYKNRGIYNAGRLTMSGGTIQNAAREDGVNGGGLYVGGGGTATMTGGTILGRTDVPGTYTEHSQENLAKSAERGSGVYVSNGSFIMTGGTVVGNIARETQDALNDEDPEDGDEQNRGTVTLKGGYVSEQKDCLNAKGADRFSSFLADFCYLTKKTTVNGSEVFQIVSAENALQHTLTDGTLTISGTTDSALHVWVACYRSGQMLSVAAVNVSEGYKLPQDVDSFSIFVTEVYEEQDTFRPLRGYLGQKPMG